MKQSWRNLVTIALFAGIVGTIEGGGMPWELKTTKGYLSGTRIVRAAGDAEQFRQRPERGVQPFLAYDRQGESPLVGQGEAHRWEFEYTGPESLVIRAAEGKWKGYYLGASDRATKDGSSFSYLLELRPEPQTFTVYQVGK